MILIGMLSFVAMACKQLPQATSPDGKTRIGVQVTESGQLNYSVTYKGIPIIHDALLGLVLENGDTLGNHLEIAKVESRFIDETYPVYAGKCDTARNKCTEITIALKEKQSTQRIFNVILRAYDDGVAFRYVVPKQPSIKTYHLLSELSQFTLGGAYRMWTQAVTKFYKNHYERPYEPMMLDSMPVGMRVQLPLVFEGEQFVGAISEAELKDYTGLYLERGTVLNSATLTATLSRADEKDIPVRQTDSIVTPWRLIMLADRSVDLIKSNLVYNLSEPCKVQAPEWIKPGKVAWDWWNDQKVIGQTFEKGMNNQTMKYFIDFAAETGLEYMLIDAGWYGAADDTIADITKCVQGIDIPELVSYGRSKNVGILLWTNWINTRNQLEEAMKTYFDWGVKGLKIDYMDGDLQRIVDFYYKTAECAARNKLLVDFHGSYKPTGLNRTYPNVMSYEGVLGLEHCKWSKRITPEHNVTIPFTRMLVGPMDYTPGAMDNRTKESFVADYSSPATMGTRAHQLAMYVVYESPLQMLSDHPAAYRGQATTEFLRIVPAAWSETLPLDGEIGKYIVLARRSGNRWFLGAMNGNEKRAVAVPLSFLKSGKKYEATVYADSGDSELNPQYTDIRKKIVTAVDVLSIHMVEGGGCAVAFSECK